MEEKNLVFFSAGPHQQARITALDFPTCDPEKLPAFHKYNEEQARELASFIFSHTTLGTVQAMVRELVQAARMESGDIFNPRE